MVPKKSWFCFQVPNFLFYLQMIAVPYLDIYNVSCACLWYFLPKSLWASHIWYIYWPLDIFCNRKCRDNATDTQSQGDPKIVKRGPNFEQKGDQKFEFFRIVHTDLDLFGQIFTLRHPGWSLQLFGRDQESCNSLRDKTNYWPIWPCYDNSVMIIDQ